MKPVTLTNQQREDALSIINDLKLAVLANDKTDYSLVPTALENGYAKYQELIESCIDVEDYHKGQPCMFLKDRICQEVFCSECYIFQEHIQKTGGC